MDKILCIRLKSHKALQTTLQAKFSICRACCIPMTQQEVATALRPFYFVVHPDLFWQFPKEKEVNENSLKLLNSYLETIVHNRPARPASLTFFLRSGSNKCNNLKKENGISFKPVNIKLLGKDPQVTVRNILLSCQLPTEYIDSLSCKSPTTQSASRKTEARQTTSSSDELFRNWWKNAQETVEDIEQRIQNEPAIVLSEWLHGNVAKAQSKLRACQPVREEIERLKKELKQTLNLNGIIWNCGWGITHFRGCLQSFRGLTVQHPRDMSPLRGRTIVFGGQTGVSFEGHIILSSEDVRHNWLDMIHSVDQFDALLQQLPDAERALSDVLRGILVEHRKFQPTVMIQKYVQQLGKLTSALYKYKWRNGYPDSWPRQLCNFQIVVECEAGPLMLSPTGQFIVPASCPAFLLVHFISENMPKAESLLKQYAAMKARESEIYVKCMVELGLSALEKDDNVTPDLMVHCCEHLLEHKGLFSRYLRDLRLRVSHYYSVLQDGEMCIPWDWKKACR